MGKQDKKTKFITKDILKSSIIGAFKKLSPRYMIKNPVMFVVEVGFFITLVMTFFPTIFGDDSGLRVYNGIVSAILFVTILFANFAESVAEGRGKAQADSLKKTKKDTVANLVLKNGTEKVVNASELKKGDIVMVRMNEVIPNDGEVITIFKCVACFLPFLLFGGMTTFVCFSIHSRLAIVGRCCIRR